MPMRYAASSRILWLVGWPHRVVAADHGKVAGETAGVCDMMPNVLDVAGVAMPASGAGRSILGLLAGWTSP